MNYFLGILIPEPISSEIIAFKEEMKTRFNSGQALYSPPHITLHMPFEWNEKKEKELIKPFVKKLSGFPQLEVELKGFGAFPPRVIFVRPESTAKLQELYTKVGEIAREDLHLLNQDRLGKPFHPHVTIAFRDLRREQFNLAWPEFSTREFHRRFLCNSISLMKKPGKYWEPCAEIAFSGSP